MTFSQILDSFIATYYPKILNGDCDFYSITTREDYDNFISLYCLLSKDVLMPYEELIKFLNTGFIFCKIELNRNDNVYLKLFISITSYKCKSVTEFKNEFYDFYKRNTISVVRIIKK